MRVACVLIAHLRAKVEMRRRPNLKGKPVVIIARGQKGRVVVDHFPVADGISVGMTPEQALSQQANTMILEADERPYQNVFHRMLTSLQGVSDQVEGAGLGIAYVRLDGLDGMYGGEAPLLAALLGAVPDYLQARIGVGDAKFPAFVAAGASKPLSVTAAPSDAAGFLAPRSIDLLPISADTRADMRRFGLHAMGDVASMPEAALVDQFGSAGSAAWKLSQGIDDSPLIPLKYEESILEHILLPFSAPSLQFISMAIDTLLKRAWARPQMRGRYAAAATLSCLLNNAPPWEKSIRFKQAAGSWEKASAIITPQIEGDHPEGPVEEIALTLSALTGEPGMQMGLLQDHGKDQHHRLVETEKGLQAHMNGRHALYQILDVAPWHPAPEMRALRIPIGSSGSDDVEQLSMPVSLAVQEGPNRQPEAVLIGKQWHRVDRIEDRWSFDLWWLPDPVTRAYYLVSRQDGKQLTLFRDRRDDCWYQHVP